MMLKRISRNVIMLKTTDDDDVEDFYMKCRTLIMLMKMGE